MRCLIVGAAPVAGRHDYYVDLIRSHAGPVVAVDGGCDLCRAAERPPELLVGDLDSCSVAGIDYARTGGAAIRIAPSEKDVTDLDIALEAAREIGGDRAIVTATWTGRLDHTLAAVGSVMRASGIIVDLADPAMTGCVLDSAMRAQVSLAGPGALFSILTVIPGTVVSCDYARYPLRRARLEPLSSRGVSNIVEAEPAVITAESGRVLVISHVAPGVAAALISDPPGDSARGILGPESDRQEAS